MRSDKPSIGAFESNEVDGSSKGISPGCLSGPLMYPTDP
jgi:hypothetical protein